MFDLDPLTPTLPAAGMHVVEHVTAEESKANRRHIRRVDRRRYTHLAQQAAAAELLNPLPGPGESLHGVMDGSFAAWSIAEAIVGLLAEPIKELTISTLGFNRQNCDSLLAMIDGGRIQRVLLNVSDYFR